MGAALGGRARAALTRSPPVLAAHMLGVVKVLLEECSTAAEARVRVPLSLSKLAARIKPKSVRLPEQRLEYGAIARQFHGRDHDAPCTATEPAACNIGQVTGEIFSAATDDVYLYVHSRNGVFKIGTGAHPPASHAAHRAPAAIVMTEQGSWQASAGPNRARSTHATPSSSASRARALWCALRHCSRSHPCTHPAP